MTSAKENILKTMSFNNTYYYWNWFVNQLFGFWSFLLWKQVKWKRSYFDDKFKASFVAVDNIISQQSLKRILDYNVKYSSLFRQAVHRECFSVYEFMSNKKKKFSLWRWEVTLRLLWRFSKDVSHPDLFRIFEYWYICVLHSIFF